MSASGIETRVVKLNDVDKDGGYIGLPGDQFVQLIAENGVFLYKNTPFYTATIEMKKVTDPTIGKLNPLLRWKVPSLTLELLYRIEDFFTQVYEKHKAEAVVLLYVSSEKHVWAAKVPAQTVSGASVEYDLKKMPQCYIEGEVKYSLFGSIHSHGSMSGSHSGTDDKDEFHFDGLHITIGDIPKAERSYAVRYVIHGTVFGPLKLRDVVDFPQLSDAKCDEAWLEQVSERKYGVVSSSPSPHFSGNFHENWRWGEQNRNTPSGKVTPVGSLPTTGGIDSSPTASLLDDRRVSPTGDGNGNGNKSKKKGKLRWQPKAQYDHCYTCLAYSEGGRCAERGKTMPFATCSRYDANPDVPERHVEEAQGWAMLMEDDRNLQRSTQFTTLKELVATEPKLSEPAAIVIDQVQLKEETPVIAPSSPTRPGESEEEYGGHGN